MPVPPEPRSSLTDASVARPRTRLCERASWLIPAAKSAASHSFGRLSTRNLLTKMLCHARTSARCFVIQVRVLHVLRWHRRARAAADAQWSGLAVAMTMCNPAASRAASCYPVDLTHAHGPAMGARAPRVRTVRPFVAIAAQKNRKFLVAKASGRVIARATSPFPVDSIIASASVIPVHATHAQATLHAFSRARAVAHPLLSFWREKSLGLGVLTPCRHAALCAAA